MDFKRASIRSSLLVASLLGGCSSPATASRSAASSSGRSSPTPSGTTAEAGSPAPSGGEDAGIPLPSPADAGSDAREAGEPLAGTLVGNGGLCLGAVDGQTASGATLDLETCTGAGNQIWKLAGGAVVSSGGTCLGLNGNAVNGTRVDLAPCDETAAESWSFQGSNLVGEGGLCLDPLGQGSTPGTPVQVWECWGGSDQNWTFCPLSGSSAPACAGAGVATDAGSPASDSSTSTTTETCNGHPPTAPIAPVAIPPEAMELGYTSLSFYEDFSEGNDAFLSTVSTSGSENARWYTDVPYYGTSDTAPMSIACDETYGNYLWINDPGDTHNLGSVAGNGSGRAWQHGLFQVTVQVSPVDADMIGEMCFWGDPWEHAITNAANPFVELDFLEVFRFAQDGNIPTFSSNIHDWTWVNGNMTEMAGSYNPIDDGIAVQPASVDWTKPHTFGVRWQKNHMDRYFDHQLLPFSTDVSAALSSDDTDHTELLANLEQEHQYIDLCAPGDNATAAYRFYSVNVWQSPDEGPNGLIGTAPPPPP